MAADNYKQPEDDKLCTRWTTLEAKKSNLMRRSEDYAMWTLPYIFSRLDVKEQELQGALDSIGARAVNNLSNKLTTTLFGQPFFRLVANDDLLNELSSAAKQGDQDAGTILSKVDEALAKAEKSAMSKLENSGHRTQATMAAKGLIITGNSLMYYPTKGKVQTYGLRDYCIVRDLSGTVIEIMTIDKKALNTFSKAIQDKIKASDGSGKYKNDNCDIKIYTQLKLMDDGKYHLTQDADDYRLDTSSTDDEPKAWPAEDLPWIPLTWNLIRGEDYGRGLVEDYAGAFHALYVLAQAEVNLVGIAADIKFLVDPGSTVDVEALNDSESGTYHSGKEGDVTTIQIDKIKDMEVVEKMVQRLEQQIGAAFLLQSATTRDAERVTAEEIRTNAQELDIANGGIYSRFADEWQYRIAVLVLKGVNVDLGKNKTIQPVIITGLDSLSREGELQSLRMLIQDLAMLNEVPEDVRAAIDPMKFAQYCSIRRGVESSMFLKTPQQMQAEQQQAQQMQATQMAQQGATNFATAAGKAAITNQGN